MDHSLNYEQPTSWTTRKSIAKCMNMTKRITSQDCRAMVFHFKSTFP